MPAFTRAVSMADWSLIGFMSLSCETLQTSWVHGLMIEDTKQMYGKDYSQYIPGISTDMNTNV